MPSSKPRPTRYEYVLCDALDPNLKKIGIITEARNRKLEIIANRPGSCSFDVPLNGRWANKIQRHKTCVKVKRNGITIWSGPVFTRNLDAAANKMTVGCIGWLEEVYARIIRPGQDLALIFNAAQPGSESYNIVYALLNAANKQRTGVPSPITVINVDGTHGDMSTAIRPTHVKQGTATLTDPTNYPTWPKFSVNFQAKAGIGASIQSVSDVENGVDIEVDPDTLELNVYYPRKGVVRDTHFGFGRVPNNLKNVTRQEDGRRGVQRMMISGQNNVAVAEDTDAMDALGLMIEESESLNDVTDGNILLAYAGAEVAVRGYGLVTDSIVLFPRSNAQSAVRIPRIFDDYYVGDYVWVSCKAGPELTFTKEKMRVFSVSMSIDENNNEIIDSMSTAPPTS